MMKNKEKKHIFVHFYTSNGSPLASIRGAAKIITIDDEENEVTKNLIVFTSKPNSNSYDELVHSVRQGQQLKCNIIHANNCYFKFSTTARIVNVDLDEKNIVLNPTTGEGLFAFCPKNLFP